jgi:DNA ligase (NAD+)
MSLKQPVRLNEGFINVLNELNDIMLKQGDVFRAKAYRTAADAIMFINTDITEPSQLAEIKGIGKTILAKLNEYVKTGKIQSLEDERLNPINQLTRVYGIGPKKAIDLISKGIKSIDDLRNNQELLTDNMKIGLKYFNDIEMRIPRSEIDEYNKQFSLIFHKAAPLNSTFQIVGSYRRGLATSGDIDIVITNINNDDKAYIDFLDVLIKEKIVIEVLSRGKTKSLTIAKLAGENDRPMRVDFLYTPPDEFPFAILYFTGSKNFNTFQRQRALDLGYSLNEHGIYSMKDGTKGEKITHIKFPDEKSIFEFLKMDYIEPQNRIDGVPKNIIIKTRKNTTLKKTSGAGARTSAKTTKASIVIEQPTIESNVLLFRKEGISALNRTPIKQLEAIITACNDAYYCNKNPIMTDNEYDIVRQCVSNKSTNNEVAMEGHTACNVEIEKNKVELPYEMWSMNKIKPDTAALTTWIGKYTGPYLLSCKLDGVSALYSTEGVEPKLYTRGNGKIGQDISHMIPFLELPTTKNIVIRGELIISKERFNENYAVEFANPRNFVAGVANQKKVTNENINKFKDVDFVAYEVIKPDGLKPTEQIAFLQTQPIKVVCTTAYNTISNAILSDALMKWRDTNKYEIDGIICTNDNLYSKNLHTNPVHAFAFKMVLSDQVAEAMVTDVIWTPSKDGYLKPRVQIEPITLGGVTIEYATGFNAKFIVENKIGVGALVRLIRSGDVIPHIVSVIHPATEPLLPSSACCHYEWNESGVDFMITNKADDETVREKNITMFFKSLGVEGLGSGIVKRIIEAKYDTVIKIIGMSVDDFLKIDGFKATLSSKIHKGIKEKLEASTLPELMHATNIFGRGFGERKFKTILEKYPDILVSLETAVIKHGKLTQIDGMADKTATYFMLHMRDFIEWTKQANQSHKLIYSPIKVQQQQHALFGKKWVMTGFRDKELINKLNEIGAVQTTSVSKNTFMVIVSDPSDMTGKVADALKLGVLIMRAEELKKVYNL